MRAKPQRPCTTGSQRSVRKRCSTRSTKLRRAQRRRACSRRKVSPTRRSSRKEEAAIDWSRSAAEIDRQIRAFDPWPVAETRWNGQQLRVWEAMPIDSPSPGSPGEVLGTSAAGTTSARATGAAPDTSAERRAARRCPQRSSSTRIVWTVRYWDREPSAAARADAARIVADVAIRGRSLDAALVIDGRATRQERGLIRALAL